MEALPVTDDFKLSLGGITVGYTTLFGPKNPAMVPNQRCLQRHAAGQGGVIRPPRTTTIHITLQPLKGLPDELGSREKFLMGKRTQSKKISGSEHREYPPDGNRILNSKGAGQQHTPYQTSGGPNNILNS